MSALPSPRPSGAREGARRPELRVVDAPRHTTRWVVILALVGALGLTGIVSLNALAAEATFKARELQQEVTRLSKRYDELTAEVAKLESPARIRRVAVTELGMVRPQEPVYLLPGEDGVTARPVRGDTTEEPTEPDAGQ